MANTYLVTGAARDLASAPLAVIKQVFAVTNLDSGEALVDLTNLRIHVGGKQADVDPDGNFSVSLIATNAGDLNVLANTVQYQVHINYIDPATRAERWWSSGWFSLTANTNVASVVTNTSPVVVKSASQYAQEAKDARDQAVAISGVATTDAAVKASFLIPGSQSAAHLAAQIARSSSINALDYGVKADGTTDDAAAWNTLVAACPAGTSITWTGRSKLGSAIIWKTGVSLVGQGRGRSVLAPTHATNYFSAIQRTVANGSSTASPMEDATFRDFEIDGSGIAGTSPNIGAKGIFAQHMRRCQILNLYVHDTGATGLGTDYMPDCLISGNVIERCGRNWDGAAGGHAGIGIGMGAWDYEPVTISDNHVIDCGHWGIFVEYQDGEAFRSRGAKIVHNHVQGTEGVGIGDRGCSETLIQGNSVATSGADGIQASYAAARGQILDNVVTSSVGSGIKFTTDVGDGWRTAGNKVTSSGARGIYFDGNLATYSNHAIENNEISLSQYQGILVDTAISAAGLWRNGVIRGNRCFNNGKAGTEADGIKLEADMSGVIVAGNRCYDDQGTKTQTVGIRLSASSTYDFNDVQIVDNHLVGNSSAGLALGAVVRTNVGIRRNAGYVTENRGASQINDLGSTVTVLHGLAAAPTSVVVTPQNGNEALWITTLGASGFIVNRAGTSGARPFLWHAEV